MATLNLVLDKRRVKKDCTYPVVFRLTANREQAFIPTGYRDIIDLETKLYQRGMSINGIGVYMRTFRAICNRAINLDFIGYEWYPFRKYKIQKSKTTPRVLSMEEIKSYFQLDLQAEDPEYKYWNLGKLIFMLRGINMRDLLLLKKENIVVVL